MTAAARAIEPTIPDDDELAQRYLAFLNTEARLLAHRLAGAIVVGPDGERCRHVQWYADINQLDSADPMGRAEGVLRAAGVDPFYSDDDERRRPT